MTKAQRKIAIEMLNVERDVALDQARWHRDHSARIPETRLMYARWSRENFDVARALSAAIKALRKVKTDD